MRLLAMTSRCRNFQDHTRHYEQLVCHRAAQAKMRTPLSILGFLCLRHFPHLGQVYGFDTVDHGSRTEVEAVRVFVSHVWYGGRPDASRVSHENFAHAFAKARATEQGFVSVGSDDWHGAD